MSVVSGCTYNFYRKKSSSNGLRDSNQVVPGSPAYFRVDPEGLDGRRRGRQPHGSELTARLPAPARGSLTFILVYFLVWFLYEPLLTHLAYIVKKTFEIDR